MGNEVLAPILHKYFAFVFEQGVFPQILKMAKVVPIFKTGNRSFTSNYRPIFLLPSLSKILEKLMKNRLICFFDKHNILYNYQHGFREKHSVLHALLDVTSLGYDAIQNKKHSLFLFMDLQKAFGTVSHKILLQKLSHYGIRVPAYKLLENYLHSRQQFVSINNYNSSFKHIQIGVSQGSILGPLLFLVYINNLPNATSSKPRLFADDTCFVLSNSFPSLLERDCNLEMQNLIIWCYANKLQINTQESFVLTVPLKLTSPSLDLYIYYNDCLMGCHNSCTYLGVYLDSKLHFQPHINQIEIKVAKAVGILSKLRFLFPKSTLILLYYALIHPHLLYALPLWGRTFPTYLTKLQRLQNKALGIIFNCKQHDSLTPLFHKLEILKIRDLYYFEIC